MIELGLSRISRLLRPSSWSWKAIHVAGTNGKGSITAYLSALLSAARVRTGRFTSPHLVDRWDCITIDERIVRQSLFQQVEDHVKHRNRRLGIGATQFELLTATAFEIFRQEQIEVGVVEAGVGGRRDATNILEDVSVSVIAKIGLDHHDLLGDSIEEIACEKAGILKPGVPCVIDGTNFPEALHVFQNRIRGLDIPAVFVQPEVMEQRCPGLFQIFEELDLEPYQRTNACCAVAALQQALPGLRPGKQMTDLLPALRHGRLPGRLQQVTLKSLVDRKEPVLLDGAHNGQSAEALGKHVDRKLRLLGHSVTWIIAASHGKNLTKLLRPLIRAGDKVAVVAFGPVDGMPWVIATDTNILAETIQSIPDVPIVQDFGMDIPGAIDWASRVSDGGPVVITGSLYLISDVLRLLRERRNALTPARA